MRKFETGIKVIGTIESTSVVSGTDFQTSDARKKCNVKSISPDPTGIEFKEFEMIDAPGITRFGVIAQELLADHAELIHTDEEGFYSVNYIDLLVREVSLLRDRVKQLEAKL